ncbi:MAG: hypothetical protein K5886_04800 [Lachnospiraceae bacterium]|nr:hypothetical protein [Lachnospiraceae bacterium]
MQSSSATTVLTVGFVNAVINIKHIRRLHEGICDRECSLPFMDICYTHEKVIDSCDMVAYNLKPFQKRNDHPEISEEEKKMLETKRQENIRKLLKDKYTELIK